VKPEEFSEVAKRHFGFLVDHRFASPNVEEFRLLYTSGELAVEVLYDDREQRALTLIDALIAQRNPRAGLSCLYAAAGLGPAQQIHEVASSMRLLERALASQAAALQDLLPILTGPDGADLLLRCHGR
jgi:hypothetical protein